MQIEGKIISVGVVREGVSNAGKPWRMKEFVLETQGQYPKKIAFSLSGDKIDKFNIQYGMQVQVSINLESRMVNNKWYTSVNAWNVVVMGNYQPVMQPAAPQQAQTQPTVSTNGTDLPF